MFEIMSIFGNDYERVVGMEIAKFNKIRFDVQANLPNYLLQRKSTLSILPDYERTFWVKFFATNNISVDLFKTSLIKWLGMEDRKRNTLWLSGPTNTGKSFLCRQILYKILSGRIMNTQLTTEFGFENILDKRVIIYEEPFVAPALQEDLKNILGGEDWICSKKYSPKQVVKRRPVLVSCNYENLSHDLRLSMTDVRALKTRMYMFSLGSAMPVMEFIIPEGSLINFLF